jgi:hypothetical protein
VTAAFDEKKTKAKPATLPPPAGFLTLEEVGAELRVRYRKVKYLVSPKSKDPIPSISVDRRRLVKRDELTKWVERHHRAREEKSAAEKKAREEELVSRAEAMRILECSRSTIHRWEDAGKLTRVGTGRVYYRLSEVLALAPEARRAAYEAERRSSAEKTRATYAPNPEAPRE